MGFRVRGQMKIVPRGAQSKVKKKLHLIWNLIIRQTCQ